MTADQTTAPPAVAFLESQEITTTDCRRCGTQLAGVNGRYSCSACGWVNHWSEGHNELPTADETTRHDDAPKP